MRHAVAAYAWLEEHPHRALVLCLAFAALVRLAFVTMPLDEDDGGFLMVANRWHGRGDSLYTDQWVDRPPMLLLVFKLGSALGGSAPAVRIVGLAIESVMIAAAWHAGAVINGVSGAVAAAIVTTGISASFALFGVEITGENIAGAFVMASCALVLDALYRRHASRTAIFLALAAGICASLAFLTKQNFIDAGIFAAILLGVESHRAWRLWVWGFLGLVIPLLVTALWAISPAGPGLSKLWVAVFFFRKHSLRVIEQGSHTAPLERLRLMIVLFFVTGTFFLICVLVAAVLRSQNAYGLRIALAVMLLYASLSVIAGASFWSHYLLQFVPALAMGAALATRRKRWRPAVYTAAAYALVACLVSASNGVVLLASGHSVNTRDQVIADFLHAASVPGDSIMLAYGSPNIIEMSGLSTPYQYSWSLPIRARDPHLTEYVRVLDGRHAPTWLVEIGDFDWWGLDTPQFQRARAGRYRIVAHVCGHALYLLDGLRRVLPPTPNCGDPHTPTKLGVSDGT